MSLFRRAYLRLSSRQLWAIALSHSLLACCAMTTVVQADAAQAVEIPTAVTSLQHAPYSRVFFTGSTYMVKDRDYSADDSAIGFFSVWSLNPNNRDLQVAVRYCLNDQSIANSGAYLTRMTLLNNDQPIVTINHDTSASTAGLTEVRQGYYTAGYDDPFWMDSDPFGDPLFDAFDYDPPLYVPAVDCSAGMSRFDVSHLAGAIAQLPDQTLQVQLQFSDGRVENLQLGHRTVEALKQLVAIRQTLAASSEPPTIR